MPPSLHDLGRWLHLGSGFAAVGLGAAEIWSAIRLASATRAGVRGPHRGKEVLA